MNKEVARRVTEEEPLQEKPAKEEPVQEGAAKEEPVQEEASQEEAVQQILSYTREQVVEAAGRLRLAAVYTLKGGAQHG